MTRSADITIATDLASMDFVVISFPHFYVKLEAVAPILIRQIFRYSLCQSQLCRRQNGEYPTKLHPAAVKVTATDNPEADGGNSATSDYNSFILFHHMFVLYKGIPVTYRRFLYAYVSVLQVLRSQKLSYSSGNTHVAPAFARPEDDSVTSKTAWSASYRMVSSYPPSHLCKQAYNAPR